METVTTVELSLAAQAADRYPTVPFELPPGARSVEVRLEGSEGVEGLLVDLGCEGPGAWRGWSGGARRWFVIREDDATPGYLPGPLEVGTWRVVLGVHTVPADGASVTVRVLSPAQRDVDHGPEAEPVQPRMRGSERGLPAPEGTAWFAGDTHAHSLHSDGALSLDELAAEAVASGLDYLCVTDHNTVSHHRLLGEVGARHGITLVPGQEITTHRGHANAYGRIGFVDFRRPAQEWVDAVAERGGVMSINHPVSGDCSWLHVLEREPAGVELYHGSWYRQPIDTGPLAWFARWRQEVTLLGGGDFHNRSTPLRPGMPTTWIAATDCSEEALLEGMRRGRTTITGGVVVTEGVGRPDLLHTPALIRDGGRVTALLADGLVLVSRSGRRRVISGDSADLDAPVADAPYRLETARRHVVALCR